jgi:hypothetical protein
MTTRKSTPAPALSRRTLIRSGAAMAALATLPGKSKASTFGFKSDLFLAEGPR